MNVLCFILAQDGTQGSRQLHAVIRQVRLYKNMGLEAVSVLFGSGPLLCFGGPLLLIGL